MHLIGHYEFGLNSFDFKYGLYKTSNNIDNKEDINFWLQKWISAYSWLLDYAMSKSNNVKFISYSKICNDINYVQKMYKDLDLNFPEKYSIVLKKNNLYSKKNFSKQLLKKAFDIYAKLKLIK
jgi:hypothetical protein